MFLPVNRVFMLYVKIKITQLYTHLRAVLNCVCWRIRCPLRSTYMFISFVIDVGISIDS